MKITSNIFEGLINDENKENFENIISKINDDIQVEVSKTFSKGIEKGKLENRDSLEAKKDEMSKNNDSMLNKYEAKINELEKLVKNSANEQYVNKFKQKAKDKLSSEQIEAFVNSTSADKLDSLDLSLFERKEIEKEEQIKPDNEPKSNDFVSGEIAKRIMNKK